MAKLTVVCEKCGAVNLVDVPNHEETVVGAFNDSSNNVIGNIPTSGTLENSEIKGETKMGEIKMENISSVNTDALVAELVKRGMKVTDVLSQKDEIKNFVYQRENGKWVLREPKSQTQEDILKNGFVKHFADYRRWLVPKTIELLGWKDGCADDQQWYKNMDRKFDYIYQFDMLERELNRLAAMESNHDTEALEIESKFFNPDMVYWFIVDYAKTVKFYIQQHKVLTQKKMFKYYHVPALVGNANFQKGNVYVEDVQKKVIDPIMKYANWCAKCTGYQSLYWAYRQFVHSVWCFPASIEKKLKSVRKSEHWVDAFEGAGAYYTADDLIRYDGLTLTEYETGKRLNTLESLIYLQEELEKFGKEHGLKWFKLMANLCKSMQDCDFNYNKVINSNK